MFNFARRINRITFFTGLLLSIVGLVLTDVGQALIQGVNESLLHTNRAVEVFQGVFILTSLLALFVYVLCLIRQRANDISGKYALIFTFLGFFVLGPLLGLIPGQQHENKYGPVPKRGLSLKPTAS